MPTTGGVVLLARHSTFLSLQSLIVYSSVGSKIRSTPIQRPCEHCDNRLLGLETNGQDFLLIACNSCKVLQLYKLDGRTITTVDSRYYDSECRRLCRAEQGVIFVSFDEGFVHEYKYSSLGFSESYNVIETGEFPFLSMCCVTNGQRALVGCTLRYNSAGSSLMPERTIRTISTHNSSVLWEFSEEINNSKLGFASLLYVAKDDVILVDDADNNRFVVLNSHDGSFLTTLKCMVHMEMPHHINTVRNIDINKDKLSVLYSTEKGIPIQEYFIAVFTFQLNP